MKKITQSPEKLFVATFITALLLLIALGTSSQTIQFSQIQKTTPGRLYMAVGTGTNGVMTPTASIPLSLVSGTNVLVPISQSIAVNGVTKTFSLSALTFTTPLSQILSVGNSVGGQDITSTDGDAYLQLTSGTSLNLGNNFGNIGISNSIMSVQHTSVIDFVAASVKKNGVEIPTLTGTETLTNKTITSPTLTSVPIAPTATINTNNSQVATTAYVDRLFNNFFNVKSYGAVGNGTTDDYTAITNCIAASLAATGNVNIFFPNGKYKVNTMLAIDNSTVNVNIIGYNSELVTGITTVGAAVLKISSANKIFIDGLSINMNNSAVVHYGLIIGDYANSKNVGVCRVENCDFFNFGVINQRGMLVENTPFVAGVVGNFNYPSCIISGCNFYNKNIAAPSITYTNNALYGIGIQFGEQTDYARVINCSFNYISIGIWSGAGANMDVTGCNFLACLPKQTTLYTYGCIYVPNTGTNNGKVNVVGCKFNHNYGYSIYWAYAGAERPLTVKGCHFIANATTAIYATHTTTVQSRMQIHDNYFERCSQAFTNSYPAQPFGASLQPFIYLNNQLRASIKLNTFLNDGTYGVTTAGGSDYILIKNNNWFNITGMSSTVGANNVISDNDNL